MNKEPKIEVGTIIHELEKGRTQWIFIVADINKKNQTKLFYFRTVGDTYLFKLDKKHHLTINYIQGKISDGEMRIIG